MVPGWPEYEVSNAGRVRRVVPRWPHQGVRVLKPTGNARGYLCVTLTHTTARKTKGIHSLVTLAFLGPRPAGLCVNHMDGNKHNNAIGNLEYVTAQRNSRHSWTLGLQGRPKSRAKITEDDVRAIRAARAAGTSGRHELAAQYGLCVQHIDLIARRGTWRHVS